jgi:hypothetical protein
LIQRLHAVATRGKAHPSGNAFGYLGTTLNPFGPQILFSILKGIYTMTPSDTVSSTLRRVNQALAPRGEQLRLCAYTSRDFCTLGRVYCVDENKRVIASDVNLKEWARELGAA